MSEALIADCLGELVNFSVDAIVLAKPVDHEVWQAFVARLFDDSAVTGESQ